MATSGDTIDVLGNLGDYNLAAGTVNPMSKTLHFVGVNGTPRLIARPEGRQRWSWQPRPRA
jgi:hypothetical protein